MFNYHLRIIQRCLGKLANASLPAYKRKLLITMIVLCTEVSFPFRIPDAKSITLESPRINFSLSAINLNSKNNSWLEFTSKRLLILVPNHYILNRCDYKDSYQPHCLITYAPKRIIMPTPSAHLVYSKRKKGDTFFSQALAKLSPINPRGPPALDLEKFNHAFQKKPANPTYIQYLSFVILEFLFGLNLIIKKIAFGDNLLRFSQWDDFYTFLYPKKSKIKTNQVRLVIFVNNLEPSLLLKRGPFLLPSKGIPNNPICWGVNRKFTKKGGEKIIYNDGGNLHNSLRSVSLRKLWAH